MKITLHLNGSVAALAAFLATVPESLVGSDGTLAINPVAAQPFPPFNLGAGEDDEGDTGPVNSAPPATDSSGMPWDDRIHASTKGTNEDGTWRKKRKVDSALVAAVEAELRGQPAAPAAMPVPAPISMPTAIPMPMAPAAIPMPMAAPEAALMAMPVAQPAPAPMPVPMAAPIPMPAPAPAPAPAPVPDAMDFAGFMAHLTGKMQTQQITSDDLVALVQQINAAFTPHGHAALGAITDLQSDQQKLTYAVQLLQMQGKW